MKRRSKFLAIFSLSLLLFLAPARALADEITSIENEVTLADDGKAHVKQVWKARPDGGSEFFIPMTHMNHMKLENFKVSDGEGKAFEKVDPRDLDASPEEKTRKYGINPISDGFELCFGKGSYEDHTYVLEYDLVNALQNFPDMDGFNIRFVNDQMDPAPGYVKTTISSPGIDFSKDNAGIWAFGYEEEINFVDGKIVAESKNFNSDSHMTILLGIEKGLLHPTYEGEGNFSDLKEEAMEGSDYGDLEEEGETIEDSNSSPPLSFLAFLFTFIFFFIFLLVRIIKYTNNKPKNIKGLKAKKGDYYRDLPAEGRLPLIYYLYQVDSKITPSNLMTAYLLKWVYEDKLRIEKVETRYIFGKKKRLNFYLPEEKQTFDYESEVYLWKVFRDADEESDEDFLSEKVFGRYISDSPDSFEDFLYSCENEGYNYALDQGYLSSQKIFPGKKILLTEKGKETYTNVYAFENYLKDFTLISEREAVEVDLWDQYLIIATIFGIADEVMKEFKDLAPDYRFSSSYDDDFLTTYAYMYGFSNRSYRSYQDNDSSSGFGGSASFGGGGGFSGGGSGGGGR